MKLFYFIVRWARSGIRGGVFLLRFLYGFELPRGSIIGENVVFNHRGLGTTVSSNSTIGDNTRLEHHVTLGVRNPGDKITISRQTGAGNCEIRRTG